MIRGFDYVKKFILNIWKNINKSNITILDAKTKLQEYSLKNYLKNYPIYILLSSKGPRHNPTFKIAVSIK